MQTRATARISREDLLRLSTFRVLPNLVKLPLFFGAMALLTWVAWHHPADGLRWPAYVALGYLWMSIVTFMHDATHNTLFSNRALTWIFGIVSMIPIFASFIAFKEDHLEHHRFNRSPRDPDAFTMGQRRPLDFLLFYAYAVSGAVLSFVHFNLLYPISRFNRRQWAIHVGETALKALVYWQTYAWAVRHDVLAQTAAVWLWPIFFFSLFNSMRFIAEHYGTPWDQGQMIGTRTVISNTVHAFFWNNINWHIGHHLYPGVPWYNLVELHRLLEPAITASGALVDRSYVAVFCTALWSGPETHERLQRALAVRATRQQADLIGSATAAFERNA